MPNYLNTAQTAYQVGRNFDVTGQQLQSAGINSGWAAVSALQSGGNVFGAAANAGLSSIPGGTTLVNAASAISSALGGPSFGGLSGTKPKALHTEYAAGSANWTKPYGAGTDITFYLQRADGGGSSASETPAAAGTGALPNAVGGSSPSLTGEPTPIGGGVQEARVRADVQAGPGLPDNMQSPLNQVAVTSKIFKSVANTSPVNPGLTGPLTGLTPGLFVAPGGSSQALIDLTPTQTAVFNVTTGAEAFAKRPTRSFPGSEGFFARTLYKSFGPDEDFDKLGSVESIELCLARAPVAELSAKLAMSTNGIASTSDLIESINYGRTGYSTSGSAAEASRVGPQGLSQRFTQ